MKFHQQLFSLLPALLLCCAPVLAASDDDFSYSISVFSDKLAGLINPDAEVRVLARGFEWSEGPVWIDDGNQGYVLFSDVPRNKIWRWSKAEGLDTFLSPSGYEGNDGDFLREPGTNGLIDTGNGNIIAANHGERQLSLINLETREKKPLVTVFEGQAFNSPNDVVMASNGSLYFTDPPYGLKDMNDSPVRALDFHGVFYAGTDGSVKVVDRTLPFPNGIGLSPDNRTLIVSSSDSRNPVWMKYTLDEQGMPVSSSVFYEPVKERAQGLRGSPDGLTIDHAGNLFATGPGGIYIFSSDGELLGRINLDRSAANCTFGGPDGNTLFITADDVLLGLETLTRGQEISR